MRNNIFEFGDTLWKQRNGTAIGTSCAVNYAFLDVGLLEIEELLTDFQPWLLFYGRFIDDGIGLWNPNHPGSNEAWREFNNRLNTWGDLRWTNTGHVSMLEFLDLKITITPENTLEFQTFRKKMNLYLYLPPQQHILLTPSEVSFMEE